MALYVSVESDSHRAKGMLDCLRRDLASEFAQSLEREPAGKRAAFLFELVKRWLNAADGELGDALQQAWIGIVEADEVHTEIFASKLADGHVKTFVDRELRECGIDADNLDDYQTGCAKDAALEIARWFISQTLHFGDKPLKSDEFDRERIDFVLSVAYQKITKQYDSAR